MTRQHYIGILVAAAALGALVPSAATAETEADGALPALTLEALASPAADASLTPFLSSASGELYLSWLEKTEEGHVLRVAPWDGEAFQPVRTVRTSDRFFANWADFASVLALGDGRLVAHWLEKAADGTYEYDVWSARSDDGGASWSEPERPHRDGTLSEHGFVSMVEAESGDVEMVWLDGREMVDESTPRDMTLRATTLGADGFGSEQLVDARVCECCQTGMARVGDSLVVAYRDRSPEEIRDIGVVRRVDGRWTEPAILHADGWEIPGCPVNGPQVAASGERVVVAWFTGADEDPRVQLAFSDDGGASFSEPIRVDDGDALGRVDVEWLGPSALVTWIERVDGRDGEVRARLMSSDGATGPPLTVARTGSSRASGFPRMAGAPDGRGVVLAWTESYDRKGPSRVRVARLDPEASLLDEPALDFEATALDGTVYRLSSLTDRVVLLNFWGIWCASCRVEIPQLVELDRRLRDRGLLVLGADYGDDVDDLPGFVEKFGMSYPVLADDGLADDYGVTVYPTSLVIEDGSRIRHRSVGYTEAGFRELESVVETLLREEP